MGTGEDKTSRVYKDVPFDLVIQLCQLYETRAKLNDYSTGYEVYTEKIEKVKAIIEYIATGGIS